MKIKNCNQVFRTESQRIFKPLRFCIAIVLSFMVISILLEYTNNVGANRTSIGKDQYGYVVSYDLLSNDYGYSDAETRYLELVKEADSIIKDDSIFVELGITGYLDLWGKCVCYDALTDPEPSELLYQKWAYYHGFKKVNDFALADNITHNAIESREEYARIFCRLYAYGKFFLVSYYNENYYFNHLNLDVTLCEGLERVWADKYSYNLDFDIESLLPMLTYLDSERLIYSISAAFSFLIGLCIALGLSTDKKSKDIIRTTPYGQRDLINTRVGLSAVFSLINVVLLWIGFAVSNHGILKFLNTTLYSYQIFSIMPKPYFNISFRAFLLIQSIVSFALLFSFFLFVFSVIGSVSNKGIAVFVFIIAYAINVLVMRYYFWDLKKCNDYGRVFRYVGAFTCEHSLIFDIFLIMVIAFLAIALTVRTYMSNSYGLKEKK